MPIDPSLILAAGRNQVAPIDPLEQAGRSMALQNLMRRGDMESLQYEEAQRGADANRRIAALFANNPQATSKDVMGIDPTRGLVYRKAEGEEEERRSKIGKERAATAKDETATQIQQAEHAASVLDFAQKNPQAYPAVYGMLKVSFPRIAQQLPEQYDQQAIGAQIAAGTSFVKKLEHERGLAQQAETGRHNLATEGNAAATLAETRANNQRPVFDHVRGVYATRPDRAGQSSVITPANMPQSPQQVQSLREDTDKLRQEFEAKPSVKSYRDVLPIAGAAQKAPDTRAGDIQMAYAVGKILDPNSVVREGELKLVGNAATVMQQIQGELRTLTQGKGRLTPETRAQLNTMLENAVAQRKASFDAEKQSYGGIVQRRGYKPEDVFIETPAGGANGWTVKEVK